MFRYANEVNGRGRRSSFTWPSRGEEAKRGRLGSGRGGEAGSHVCLRVTSSGMRRKERWTMKNTWASRTKCFCDVTWWNIPQGASRLSYDDTVKVHGTEWSADGQGELHLFRSDMWCQQQQKIIINKINTILQTFLDYYFCCRGNLWINNKTKNIIQPCFFKI